MAGIKAPKAPKSPKAPKVDAKKAGGAAKKKAAGKLKKQFNWKKLLLIVIPLLLIAVGALLIYLFMFGGPAPSETVQDAIDAAFIEDEERFKKSFTPDSVSALESAWSGADFGVGSTRGSWGRMMRGLLTEDEMKPKIVEEAISEDGMTAEVLVDIDGVKRTIHLDLIDEVWLINVNLEIDPNQLVLPSDEFSEEAMEELAMSDPESDMWWEDREAAEAEKKAAEEKGCLCAVPRQTPESPTPLGLFFGFGVGLWWLRRRRGMSRAVSGISTRA